MGVTKIGIIGCGVISNTYIRDIKRLCQDIEIVGVAAINLSHAKATAEKYGIRKAYTVEELLADEEIEMVVNLTPPAAHTEINLKVLNAGKHLFCEKPFALNMEDAEKVATLANEKGLKLGVAPEGFMGSALSTCKKLVDDNWIGKPLYVTMNMVGSGVETWHPVPEHYYRLGGGPIFDMGGYYFTPLVNMFGPVKTIYAVGGKGFEERTIYTPERFGTTFSVDVLTHYSFILTMENGMIVSANFSFDVWKTNLPMFEVYGTDGTLIVPDPNMHGGTPMIYRKEQKLASNFGGVDNGNDQPFPIPELSQNVGTYVRCLGVADLAEAIRENRKPKTNSDLALHVLEIMLGVMKSAETGEVYHMTH